MVATYHQELLDLQESTGRKMFYEAAVCGAIPVIRTLDQYFTHDNISSIEGVFNGTANYILSKMEEGSTYDDALKKAQDLGLAEADPTSDVEGWDAKYKLCISHKHAFGQTVALEKVPNCGIDTVTATEQKFAQQNNYRIRLKAIAKNGQFSVMPHFVSSDDFAYHLKGEANYMEIKSEFAGDHVLQGPGAGGFPTASALVSDIGLYQENYQYQYSQSKSADQNVDQSNWFYVRGVDENELRKHTYECVRKSRDHQAFYFVKSNANDLVDLQPDFIGVVSENIVETVS